MIVLDETKNWQTFDSIWLFPFPFIESYIFSATFIQFETEQKSVIQFIVVHSEWRKIHPVHPNH